MLVVFQAEVTQIGDMVEELAKESTLILFDQTAPKELHEISVLHQGKQINADVQVSDVLIIDDQSYPITFVGGKANQTLDELGHVTIRFNGGTEDMPGTICVEENPLPSIEFGSHIQIRRNK